MRSLSIFGAIALYIACAFVPPSEANVHAMVTHVAKIRSLNTTAFTQHLTPTPAQVKQVKALANKAVALSPKTIVTDTASALKNVKAKKVTQAATKTVGILVPDPKAAALKLAQNFIAPVPAGSSLFRNLLTSEQDPIIRKQLERIEWAANKNDPRLCKALGETETFTTPSLSDLLALCLARTTRDSSRCLQIDETNPAFRHACTEELAPQA